MAETGGSTTRKRHSADDVLAYADKIVKGTPPEVQIDDILMKDRINTDISHTDLFLERGKAFVRGADLLISNLEDGEVKNPAARTKLKAAVVHLYSAYEDELQAANISSPAEGKRLLDEFLVRVVILLESQTTMKAKVAGKRLAIAERVANWNAGRKSLVTISDTVNPVNDNKQVVVQVEVPRCELTLAQKKEFVELLSNNTKPVWFKAMPRWEQKCLLERLSTDPPATLENINDKIQTIPTLVRHVPGLANFSQHVLRVYEAGKEGDFTMIAESRRERSGVVCPVDLYKSEYDDERQRITDGNVGQMLVSLEDRALRFAETWGTNSFSIPVTYQTLLSPGIVTSTISGGANDNAMMVKNKNEAINKLKTALANPTDMDSKAYLAQLGLRMNDKGEIEYKGKNGQTIYVKPIIVSTNHSVNAWRAIPEPFKSSEKKLNGSDSIILLAQVGEFLTHALNFYKNNGKIDQFTHGEWGTLIKNLQELKQYSSIDNVPAEKRDTILAAINASFASVQGKIGLTRENDLKILLQAVRDYIETPHLKVSKYHRPFFQSSLEQIISDKLGGVGSGSCKSGKDRKGLETLHTDAMLIYQSRYGSLPRYDDQGAARERFVEICVELYMSRHQHEIASQNSPGACGLKELKNILPKDIREAIGEKELSEANKYGSLNKVNTRLLDDKEKKKELSVDVKKIEEDLGLSKSARMKSGKFSFFSDKLFGMFNRHDKKNEAAPVINNQKSRLVK